MFLNPFFKVTHLLIDFIVENRRVDGGRKGYGGINGNGKKYNKKGTIKKILIDKFVLKTLKQFNKTIFAKDFSKCCGH